jgi:hypothetical protein
MVQGIAIDLTEDGSVIVGLGSPLEGGSPSFIWDADNGMRDLEVVLTEVYGLDLTDWPPLEVWGISDDGSTLMGTVNERNTRVWVAVLPEPTSGLLGASALAALTGLAAVRRRSTTSEAA